MTPTQIFFLGLIGQIFIAIVAVIVALLGWKQGRATHILINSRMDELLESTRKTSRANGIIEGAAVVGIVEGREAIAQARKENRPARHEKRKRS